MNTFIQWQETIISDAYLTDTPSYFPFIEPNISLLPQGSLASIASNALIKTVGIDFDLNQLLMFENEDIIKEVKDKCRRMFEDKFFNEIRNSSRLLIYQDLKKKFEIEPYINEVKYYNYRSAISALGTLPANRKRTMDVRTQK